MNISVTLDYNHWQSIKSLLGRAPFNEVAPLIGAIQQQLEAQQLEAQQHGHELNLLSRRSLRNSEARENP
jgi:hypothetical protein